MKSNSFKAKLILLIIFILIIVAIILGFAFGKKRKPSDTDMWQRSTVTYSSDDNGYLIGNTEQSFRKYHNDGTEVTAVPNDGYIFAGWSDNVLVQTRKDSYEEQNKEVQAKFISKFKTLKYNYNGATYNNTVQTITLNYDDVTSTPFIIPEKANCEFQGWYLDKEFTTRVTDKDGVYYLGKSIFYYNSDTLYARWDKKDGIVYPVLMIFANKIDAQLKTRDGGIFSIKYEMNIPEILLAKQSTRDFSECLNKAFDGRVYFDVDIYYTNDTITSNNYGDSGGNNIGLLGMFVYPPLVPEVSPILMNYRSVITTAEFHNATNNEVAGGMGTDKFACVSLSPTSIRYI